MTKADLVSAMAKASGGSKVSAERALDAFFVSVFDALKRGRRVTLGGFGTFMVSKRAARRCRHLGGQHARGAQRPHPAPRKGNKDPRPARAPFQVEPLAEIRRSL